MAPSKLWVWMVLVVLTCSPPNADDGPAQARYYLHDYGDADADADADADDAPDMSPYRYQGFLWDVHICA